MDELFSLIDKVLAAKALQKIVFSRPKDKSVKKVEGRVIELKGRRTLQIETFHTDGRATHKDCEESFADEYLRELCAAFSQIDIFTSAGYCEALISSKGKCRLIDRIKGELTQSEAQKNDREHRYLLDRVKCAPFLSKLGVASPDGRILGKMGHSERKGTDICKNVPGAKDQHIFENGVKYFG